MRTKRTTIAILTGLLACAFLAGCGGGQEPPPPVADPSAGGARAVPIPEGATMPEGHPPIDAGAGTSLVPPPEGAGTGAAALTWSTPAGWVEEPPSSNVRRAQYRVPGPGGDAEMVVFYFGPGQGGDPMSNAARWAGQFSQPDGSDSLGKLKTSEQTVGTLAVVRVELEGRYENPMTGDPPIADAILLGAVVTGPDANWYFKLTGPRATVEDQRDEFDALVGSLSSGG